MTLSAGPPRGSKVQSLKTRRTIGRGAFSFSYYEDDPPGPRSPMEGGKLDYAAFILAIWMGVAIYLYFTDPDFVFRNGGHIIIPVLALSSWGWLLIRAVEIFAWWKSGFRIFR